MSYDFVVETLQGALCIATFGLIAAVAGKTLARTLSPRGLLAGRAAGKIEPERLLALAMAIVLPALYLIHCITALMNGAVPRALPAAEPWMVAALLASQALYLGGKFLRS